MSQDSTPMTGSDESYIIHRMSQFLCFMSTICILLLTGAHSMHALFSVCSLRDDNVIISKST